MVNEMNKVELSNREIYIIDKLLYEYKINKNEYEFKKESFKLLHSKIDKIFRGL